MDSRFRGNDVVIVQSVCFFLNFLEQKLSSRILDKFLDEFKIMSFKEIDESVGIIGIDSDYLQLFSR